MRYEEIINDTIQAQQGSDTTPVTNTTGSYRKAVSKALEINPNIQTILDYGAGIGYGTDAMREVSQKDVHSYEPSPTKWFKMRKDKPTFTKNTDISGKYDAVISLNVVNVLEPDLRRKVVLDIVSKLNPNGVAIIGSRKYKGTLDIIKTAIPAEEEKAVWVGGKVYQKGYDGSELVDYLKSILPTGYIISKISNICDNAAIIIKQ